MTKTVWYGPFNTFKAKYVTLFTSTCWTAILEFVVNRNVSDTILQPLKTLRYTISPKVVYTCTIIDNSSCNKVVKLYASAGNGTRIDCLEGNHANLYTTDSYIPSETLGCTHDMMKHWSKRWLTWFMKSLFVVIPTCLVCDGC